jgi:hypothetical protein
MASGDTLLIFTPANAEFPATNYPTFDTRNNHLVLDFDTTTAETVYFKGVMPQSYSGTTGVTVYIHWAASTATSGTIQWSVAFERIGDSQQDIDSDGFAAVNDTTATTVPATSGHVDITSVAFTDGADMDSVAAGEGFRLSVARDVDGDNATGDAELWAIEIRET